MFDKKNLLIVESPSKVKTIMKYLDSSFNIISSFGHVRSIPSKKGYVIPEKNFEIHYETLEKSKKNLAKIILLVKESSVVYFATDPDREGEAISWHLLEIIKKKSLFLNKRFYRITFHELTKRAILEAINNPGKINQNLVNAQRSRQALDYLIGFSLSELLWRKVPKARSAGRVQSVALRIICELEKKRKTFSERVFWKIHLEIIFDNYSLAFDLVSFGGEKVDKFFFEDEKKVISAIEKISQNKKFLVKNIQKATRRISPKPPLITSTLQQKCINEYLMRAYRVMQVAQELYEGVKIEKDQVALITYMRTDSTSLSKEASTSIRNFITENYGRNFLPDKERIYKSKVKNIQEAHECIRPTRIENSPEKIKIYLTKEQYNVYKTIWNSAVMSQMKDSLEESVFLDIQGEKGDCEFRYSLGRVKFKGFKILEKNNDCPIEDLFKKVCTLRKGDYLYRKKVFFTKHKTEPPARFSEATLVKTLEKLGIGRPSTYAGLIQILLDRGYAVLEKRRFIPTSQGEITNAFLVNFFPKYVNINFTSEVEDDLDLIAKGGKDYRVFLDEFWEPFNKNVQEVYDIKRSSILEKISVFLHDIFLGQMKNTQCSKCKTGKVSIKFGRYGVFIGCSGYPDCKNIIPVSLEKSVQKIVEEGDIKILLCQGKFGPYLELYVRGKVIKRLTVPVKIKETIKPDLAKKMVEVFPRKLEYNKKEVVVSVGTRGGYIRYGKRYLFLDLDEALLMSNADILRRIRDTFKD